MVHHGHQAKYVKNKCFIIVCEMDYEAGEVHYWRSSGGCVWGVGYFDPGTTTILTLHICLLADVRP
jgi:hypothetical protein